MLDAEATMAAFERKGKVVVQDDAQVMAPLEVTLDDIARQRAVDREANQPTAEGYAKAEVPDLRALIIKRVELMGPAAASVYFKKPVKQVKRWIEGAADPGLEDLMLTLERPASTEDRQAAKAIEVLGRVNLEEGEIMVTPERPRMPVMVSVAVKGEISALIAATWFALGVRHSPYLNIQADTLLVRSRNILAHRFLQSELPWCMSLDSDVLMPMGSEVFQRAVGSRKLGLHSLQMDLIPQLLSYQKEFVGAVYAARAPGAQLVIQPDYQPRNDEDRAVSDAIREGQSKGLYPVSWVASGAALIHRNVFLRVMEVFKDRIPVPAGEPFPFYTPMAHEGQGMVGEDIAFCMKCQEAGIPMFLASDAILGHRGSTWYLPEMSAPARRFA